MATEEQSIQERIENIIEPPPAPVARKTPEQAQSTDEEIEIYANEPDPDDEPAAELTDDAPDPEAVDLDIDGEPVKLTRTQLAAIAKEHREMKVSTQTLQEQRAAVEQQQRINLEIGQIAPHVEQLRAEGRLLQHAMQGLYQEVRALTESDPIAAMQKNMQLQELQGRFNQLAQAEGQVSGKIAQMRQFAAAKEIEAEMPLLLQKIPAWKDPAKRQSDQTFIRNYMKAEGYPAMEIEMVTRSRYAATLLKAAKYDQITKSRASKKIDNAPPLARPGTPAMPGQKAATQRMEYKKAIRAAPTESARAKIIQKRIEGLV